MGKGSRDDGSLRTLPPCECLGDALFLQLIPAANFDPWCATTFSLCGLLLAMYEDVNVFPVLMRGYNAYKDTTPFLFPTKESIRRCFNGKKAK